MIGREVTVRGERGVVEAWEPLSSGMCDTLIRFASGSVCWFASHELAPVDGMALPTRQDARRRADVVAASQLRAIRAAHAAEFSKPWPGCEYGKALVGAMVDGALDSLRSNT